MLWVLLDPPVGKKSTVGVVEMEWERVWQYAAQGSSQLRDVHA